MNKTNIFIAGLVLGMGAGLKLTASIFILAAIVATACLPIPKKQRFFLHIYLIIGITVGVLLTAGYWMLLMWHEHHNPLFPFFNNIFHSQDFVAAHWRDKRFLPHGIWQSLFYPFYFSFDGRTADAPFRDIRFILLYVLFVCTAIKLGWQRKRPDNLAVIWLMIFFVSGYIIWQSYFAIARYLATLEMLAPLMMYLLVCELTRTPMLRFALLSVLFYAMIIMMQPIPLVRSPEFNQQFFNIKLPEQIAKQQKALVLMAYTAYVLDANPRPQTYLIPYFPKQWRFVGVPFWQEAYLAEADNTQKIIDIVQHTHQPIYLLTSGKNMPMLLKTAALFGLVPNGLCESITSDRQAITHQTVLICPVKTRSS